MYTDKIFANYHKNAAAMIKSFAATFSFTNCDIIFKFHNNP